MKVLIDTNVLISAALNKDGVPYRAYMKAVTHPNKGVICEQNIDEMRRIFNRKFPQKIEALESFLSAALLSLDLVTIPEKVEVQEKRIRDVKDRPILRAAIMAQVDVILTGDKDFLESEIEKPCSVSPAEFVMQ